MPAPPASPPRSRPPQRGARVLLVEKDVRIGGTLHTTGGHMAAGGHQAPAGRHGIEDTAEAWIADIRRDHDGTSSART